MNSATLNDPMIRLNKYLASCGKGSRRSCDDLISAGHVLVNGIKVTGMGTKIDPDRDTVTIQGHGGVIEPIHHHEYWAYYKPRGLMVTADDPQGRPTIYDAIQKQLGRPVNHFKYCGRLDLHSEGLLVLTSDGDLVYALTHPRFQIKKVYHVCINKTLAETDRKRMVEDGIESEDVVLHAASITPLRQGVRRFGTDGRLLLEEFWYEVVLFEGKKRQIRRMFSALSYDVARLKRVQFSSVTLDDLDCGALRRLTEKEVASLKNSRHR